MLWWSGIGGVGRLWFLSGERGRVMGSQITEIELSKVRDDVHGQRLEIEGDKLDELIGSIRRVGILVPLFVVADGDGFVLVAGHRRLAAAKRIGLSYVPCIVRSGEDKEIKEVGFAENFFRENLSPIEQAAAIKDAVDQEVLSVDELAAGFRRSADWVRRQIALLSWPPDVLEVIHRGKLSVSAASNLACVRDDAYRGFLLGHAVANGATARTTAAWLQAWEAAEPAEQAVTSEPVPEGQARVPAVPQAPCIVCATVYRTDELSHVPMCSACIRKVQGVGR
jgi:ParB family chromosome partitioning protein